MSDHHSRRPLALEPGRGIISSVDLQPDDIEAFLDEHAHRDPELVSVTIAIDDPVSDPDTTNWRTHRRRPRES